MADRFFANELDDGQELSPADARSLFRDAALRAAEEVEEANKRVADPSVYTGRGGIALMYLKLLVSPGFSPQEKAVFLKRAHEHVDAAVKARPRRRDITFLCGEAGPWAVAAVVCHLRGDAGGCAEYVTRVANLTGRCASEAEGASELLYGLAGALWAALFLLQELGPRPELQAAVPPLARAIIRRGLAYGHPHCPLMYEWHEEMYLGAAHGLAGIVYVLLQVPGVLDEAAEGPAGATTGRAAVRGTLDFLLARRFPSGNFHSSVGSERDRLVQWCHGAPGLVAPLLLAARVLGEPGYRAAALEAGDVTWARGLLRKGPGLCHGLAGNGYALLALHRETGEGRHLRRAQHFARFFLTRAFREGAGTPDRPHSLFEGLAGYAAFAGDLAGLPEGLPAALFPAFELRS